mmetsp:Transcript_44670/g.104077  ORF Transcript_44670/g.104077 Transcript_44670/m.104077 type:complete len:232 (+) Transcript_44670:55-750(+)
MVSLELARVAERAERYDDMAEYMKERVLTGQPLDTEERDMFSAAFKNALTERRVAVRIAVQVHAAELSEGHGETANLADGYKTRVENELQGICEKALNLLDTSLLPNSDSGEAKTFYLKMKGDYCRYMAEFTTGASFEKYKTEAAAAYATGLEEAAGLHQVHPVRLGLALNFSVFQHEVLRDTDAALATANSALESASQHIDEVPEESRSDAFLTLQLLSDNTQLWTAGAM